MADYHTTATVTPYLPRDAFTDKETEMLEEAGFTAYPCSGKNEKDLVYLYCEEYCGDEGMDVLFEVLKRLPEKEYPYIYLEAACTCTKMRSDGFGGFAWFITRQRSDCMGTGSWVARQIGDYDREKEAAYKEVVRKRGESKGETVEFITKGETETFRLTSYLAVKSRWFQATPLPDDECRIEVKNEGIQAIRDFIEGKEEDDG